MKVAVVRNSSESQPLSCLGLPCPEKYGRRSIEAVIAGLVMGGHEVALFESDVTLFDRLRNFFGLDGQAWTGDGMVFNMVYGIQGECRYTHLPAMLEMAGVPYTGSSPLGHALALDKIITKTLIHAEGIATPRWFVAHKADQDPGDLNFPLMVKPRHESTSYGLRVVNDRRELEEAVAVVLNDFGQEALVEEFIDGREVCVALLGNDPVECLPIVELDFGGRDLNAFTLEDKMHQRLDEPQRHCPAELPEALAAQIREMAIGTFHACHCRDYSRVDFRIDAAGNPFVLEINSMASLGENASYVMAANAIEHTFSSLVCRIVDVAHQRSLAERAAVAGAIERARLLSEQSTVTQPTEPQPSESLRLREEFAA